MINIPFYHTLTIIILFSYPGQHLPSISPFLFYNLLFLWLKYLYISSLVLMEMIYEMILVKNGITVNPNQATMRMRNANPESKIFHPE